MQTEGSQLLWGSDGTLPIKGEACLQAELDRWLYLEPGWSCSQAPLPTFTTSRPSPKPMRKPANLSTCKAHEVERWKADRPRFPPYKYPDSNCVVSARGEHRPPNVAEREAILGFPIGFTRQCMPKASRDSIDHVDCRLSPLGHSWSIPVITWLLSCLFSILGFIEPRSV